jgi:hypothetical protein
MIFGTGAIEAPTAPAKGVGTSRTCQKKRILQVCVEPVGEITVIR